MAHAHKGGISHSPGNNSRPQSNDTHHRGDDSPSDGRKQSRQIDPSEQQFRGRKRRHGAPLQRFLPWLAENATMGPLETPRSGKKGPKRSGEARKATEKPPNGAPNAILDPCSEAPYRRFLPSCEQNRATAASRKEKPVKRYEHLTGFRSDALNPLRTQHVFGLERIRKHSQPSFANPSSNAPSKHRFDMALRLFH